MTRRRAGHGASDFRDGGAVVLYSLRGWKHFWPGRFFTDRLDPEDPLRGFDAGEIIWSFFRKRPVTR